ncbi:chitinase 3 [Fusarium heterosporum]|uniref:chitinase n=1 Tax=Fusarium heterosporum TaxID=42747 RepID=A0A8H5T787_FUSHE|nr:chitinase 3 [Fusarium heterosporum]
MVSRFSSIAFWAVALCFLSFVTLSNADTPRHPHVQPGRINRRSVINKAPEWAKDIVMSPAHQNPAEAPPNPTEDLELSLDSGVSLDQYYKDAQNATESSAGVTPNKSGLSRRSLEKRGDGPLYCKDRKCPDDSCCGPKGICGYGPDYCGKGCTSNCDAKAMCGEYSEEGEMPCGMNLCCSATGWCGTTEAFCDNADPLHKTLPCQAGYGGCNIVSSPSCTKGGGSTNGRTIGYYQSWNVRTRKCDTKTPKQLDTKGFTHLFYSFAFIDPVSFKLTPAHNDDVKQMREFTDLSKGGKLKTWIAIGGYDMSNENAPTHTTWSDMVSTKANRAAFIASVRDYMDEYGFTGVDLDWEYPGEPKRGGRKLADTRNLSMLLREMRAAYGTKYGISLTLAPDYWYLRWFDAKAMEPYVDFFGFMAYDLHGSWDSDVLTLGKIIRGQADIREIHNNTIPLWFAGLDPKKINFGLAMYGRGYTVSDKSCNGLGCSFEGPSKKGECTDSDGVMSLGEIKNLIKNKGVKSTYLKDSLMKQIAWDDQWIGYDDEETFAAKKAWADGFCFGGTMVWSIDFQASGSSGSGSGGNVPALGMERPGIPESLKNEKLPDCVGGEKYDDIKDMGKFWYNTKAEEWVDKFIKTKKDHSLWAQELYLAVFPKGRENEFLCNRPGANCAHGKECKDFNDLGLGGLYYMFQSIQNNFQYLNQLHENFGTEMNNVRDNIVKMRIGLDLKSTSDKASLDVSSILGSALGMVSTGAGYVPGLGGVAGPASALSGLFSLLSATLPEDSEVSLNEAIEATDSARALMIDIKEAGLKAIENIIAGTYGKQGSPQSLIPKAMLVGDSKFEPCVQDKALFWQMARRWRGLFVVIRVDLTKDKCIHPNNAWDDDKKQCLDLLGWRPTRAVDSKLGGIEDNFFGWHGWGMDKLKTMQNAVKCWEKNGGHVGKPSTDIGSLATSNPYDLECFFSMPVIKGEWAKYSNGAIWMVDYVGQDGQHDLLWPKSKCEAENKERNRNPFKSGKWWLSCSTYDLTKDLV